MGLKPYHHAWLSAHPNRTEGWLRERLADGFDIHHADGDHANDEPSNLVLIEMVDHMRLHNRPGALVRMLADQRENAGLAAVAAGRLAEQMRADGHDWRAIERRTGYRAGTLATYMYRARGRHDPTHQAHDSPGDAALAPRPVEPVASDRREGDRGGLGGGLQGGPAGERGRLMTLPRGLAYLSVALAFALGIAFACYFRLG